ncbi:MAG: DUF3048 domain-containing protein, partial [Candidatus Saccharimonadales bacterium]
ALDTPKPDKPGSSWKQKLTLHWPPGRKEAIVAAVIVLLLGGVTYALVHNNKPATLRPIPKVTSKTKTVPSTLTGLPVDPIVNKRTVTGVMIENSWAARPQSGLGQAGVVFEAIAEGGVTRFLALYQDTAPSNIGPVRSARPYFIQWNQGFNAGYAHVGGSTDGLADIKKWDVRDLDQFSNPGYYHRINTRYAPHNMYTSITTLNQLEVKKGYVTSHFTGFARKKASPAKQPTAASIKLTLSGPDYDVHYNYNAKTNSYLRNEGGAPQIDANTNKQISPKVVVAMVMPYSFGSLDSTGAYYSIYKTIGDGPVYVFQDGTVTTGRWYKSSATSQFVFKTTAGQAIRLNPGYTWLTALAGTDDVKYSP